MLPGGQLGKFVEELESRGVELLLLELVRIITVFVSGLAKEVVHIVNRDENGDLPLLLQFLENNDEGLAGDLGVGGGHLGQLGKGHSLGDSDKLSAGSGEGLAKAVVLLELQGLEEVRV